MARIARVAALLRTIALLSWRDVRSLGSIAGQNFLLFAVFVALQPESAEFFLLLLMVVLLFPLSTDPMEKVPQERRYSWPVLRWEWSLVRAVSILLSPISWIAIVLLVRADWRVALIVCGAGIVLYTAKHFAARLTVRWSYRIPAPPGIIGSIARLQWRSMLHTLDPYLAFTLMASTALYRFSGKPLDPGAPRILSLLVALALSTHAQVLFGIDGRGTERYRLLPIRGWQILLAKDLAFLVLLSLIVMPLDLISGLFGGIAALTIGHHNSVFKPVRQARWRFTSGVLFPHGLLQTAALFSIGSVVRTQTLPFAALCLLAWASSIVLYGWCWDRR